VARRRHFAPLAYGWLRKTPPQLQASSGLVFNRREWSTLGPALTVSMERRIAGIKRFTVGWTAYYCVADSPYRFERFDKWLRRRLRQVRWKE